MPSVKDEDTSNLLWREGPKWLRSFSSEWPTRQQLVIDPPEARKIQTIFESTYTHDPFAYPAHLQPLCMLKTCSPEAPYTILHQQDQETAAYFTEAGENVDLHTALVAVRVAHITHPSPLCPPKASSPDEAPNTILHQQDQMTAAHFTEAGVDLHTTLYTPFIWPDALQR